MKLTKIPLNIEGAKAKREMVLAEETDTAGRFVLRSIPAFVYGLAYGDVIELIDPVMGSFQILSRGGKVTVRLFVRGGLDSPNIHQLIEEVCSLGGLYEVAKNASEPDGLSLLLVSIDVSIGLDRISGLFSVIEGANWEYGNVYDNKGARLEWCCDT